MILFFGVRPLKAKSKILKGVTCPFCRQKDSLSGSLIPHYFHLFWIPLFKVYTSKQVVCSYCKRGFYKEEFSAEMEEALNN